MAIQLQLRRGTTAENDAFTGAVAEVTVDTDTHELRVHDGSTAGGFTVASKADMTTALSGKADVATTLAGYGITDGANTDLSNLTASGANIGNWSSNVTNCITEIPQDIKLEINTSSHVLTLKAGSKLYVPNGFEEDGTTPKFDIIITESDLPFGPTGSASAQGMVYIKSDGTTLAQALSNTSGTTAPADGMWYDTTTNLVKSYSGGADTGSRYSFPIALATRTNGNWTSIDQVFNGFGYIGSTVFALPGVKGLVPDGRNADGTLKNVKFEISDIQTETFDSTATYNLIPWWIKTDGSAGGTNANIKYHIDINKVLYDVDMTQRLYCNSGTVSISGGKITSFTPKTVFHILDWNDTEYMAHQAMPSDRYYDLTLPATGNTISMPADGYLVVVKAGSANEYLTMVNNNSTISCSTALSASTKIRMFMPVKRGDSVLVTYTASGTTDIFRLVYAEGAQ